MLWKLKIIFIEIMSKSMLAGQIKSQQGDYNIYAGEGILDKIFSLSENEITNSRIFLISDLKVFSNIGTNIIKTFESNSIKVESLSIELDESKKDLSTVTKIYEWLHEKGAERSDIIFSLGGGVATDLVGYVAATWLRGIKLIHIPTTLASMVDASIGGKTAVNLKQGKNLVGAFYQPKLIIMDTESLVTLPQREMNSGWAEALKHSLLFDKDLFDKFNNNSAKLLKKEDPIFSEIIRRSVEIKANIVSKDEYETGEDRIRLNFGHTIGHALETYTSYTDLLHGEAVSIGMVVATKISSSLSYCGENLVNKIEKLLNIYNLPTRIPEGIDLNNLYNIAKSDKKVKSGKINWILLEEVGKSKIINDVPDQVVIDSLTNSQ
ncbi:MAG: 3-dehydroquinate synthase [Chloroflexi bacterium]|nr:3-dehydroquinate synthase [Chloroflexota bacterium]